MDILKIKNVDDDYRFLLPQQRGFYPSDSPSNRTDYTINKLRDDIINFIEKLCPNADDEVHLVLHDIGGLGFLVAAASDRVTSVISVTKKQNCSLVLEKVGPKKEVKCSQEEISDAWRSQLMTC